MYGMVQHTKASGQWLVAAYVVERRVSTYVQRPSSRMLEAEAALFLLGQLICLN